MVAHQVTPRVAYQVAYIVVTEGLAYEAEQGREKCSLSDYFEAVLNQIIQTVPPNRSVFISPGNSFTCPTSEEEYAAEYLRKNRPDLEVIVPDKIGDQPYLDTFDNARLLRFWLQRKDMWPLGKVSLYCNAPHSLRSFLLFRLCGFDVQQVVTSRPEKVTRKIVDRLWFYNYLPIQILYECTALVYNLGRWIAWQMNQKS